MEATDRFDSVLTLRLVGRSDTAGRGSPFVNNAGGGGDGGGVSKAVFRGSTAGSSKSGTAEQMATATAALRARSPLQHQGPDQAGEGQGSRQPGVENKKYFVAFARR